MKYYVRSKFYSPLTYAFSLFFRLLFISFFVLFFILLFTPLFSLPVLADENAADGPQQGIYELSSVLNTDFVLDVRTCTAKETTEETDSHPLQMYRSLDVNQQKFYLEKLPGDLYRISALRSGKTLTAGAMDESSTPDVSASPIFLDSLQRSAGSAAPESQTWILEPSGDGCFYVRSSLGKYLAVEEGSLYNGASICLKDFTGSRKQKWILKKTWISETDTADTDLINPYEADGPCTDLCIFMKFGEENVTLTSQDLLLWAKETEEHQIELDTEALTSYVEKLAQTYDTQGCPRKFKTSYGNEITLYKGNFGWKLDVKKTVELLRETARKRGRQWVEPVWEHKGKGFTRGDDIGDSYVEVDLTNQKVWLYKDGEKLLETDCVTGTLNTDRQTPGGVYSIFYLQSPAVLRGADYASPVQYWMAFNGNIGLHDANWRSQFGGDIYKTNGSHGCVNLPTDAAAKIYEVMETGYPVVCYN